MNLISKLKLNSARSLIQPLALPPTKYPPFAHRLYPTCTVFPVGERDDTTTSQLVFEGFLQGTRLLFTTTLDIPAIQKTAPTPVIVMLAPGKYGVSVHRGLAAANLEP